MHASPPSAPVDTLPPRRTLEGREGNWVGRRKRLDRLVRRGTSDLSVFHFLDTEILGVTRRARAARYNPFEDPSTLGGQKAQAFETRRGS